MNRRDGPPARLLVALCGAGVLALNFPLLLIFDKPVTVLGLPLLPVALFAIWALLVGLLALVSGRDGGE
ncbi:MULTISPECIES: hypothetical protein [unclassified Paracoccus (in: a-proteobacteria)]|uniref:hypothetical protein n=1 Tax=unclassified Paracoccus (in: a-proteobacteria) TaxID=2688777 RepID=UPI00038092D6|nr:MULTISPECIES: hypothetical protein [unclassified Paracoccus (in: a-proteobacteria)]MCV2445760.1 hypothetical protein [Paracoccus sp. DMF]